MDMDRVRAELRYLDDHIKRFYPKLHVTPAMVEVYLEWIEKGVERHIAIMHFETAMFDGQRGYSSDQVFWALTTIILLAAPLIIALHEVVTKGMLRDGTVFVGAGVVLLVYGMFKSTGGEPLQWRPLLCAVSLGFLLYYVWRLIDEHGSGPAVSLPDAVHGAVLNAVMLYGLVAIGMYGISFFLSVRDRDIATAFRKAIRAQREKD